MSNKKDVKLLLPFLRICWKYEVKVISLIDRYVEGYIAFVCWSILMLVHPSVSKHLCLVLPALGSGSGWGYTWAPAHFV